MNNQKTLRTLCVSFLLALFMQGITILSAEGKDYNTKPYDFVASLILKNKIVMLAENGALGHYNLFPYITFINVIKCWNNKAKEENVHDKTLTLIIEKCPSVVKLIQNYIDNDDPNPFLDKMGINSSLEELYLFDKLRELNNEIKRNNNQLNIVGFEIDERYEDEYFFKKTDEERNIFIARDRDSLLYNNISSFIINHPKDNILIVYGSAHLEEKYTSKISPTETCNGKGYYLAYYLRREFGSGKFITVDQTFIDDESFNYGNDLAYLKDKNFLVKKGDQLFRGKVPFTELKSDYTIIRHDGLAGPRFIRYVFSRNNLLRCYTVLAEFENLCKKYNRVFSLKSPAQKNSKILWALASIRLITGIEFNSIKDYKNYLDTTEKNFNHDRIFSKEISNELFNYLKDYPSDIDFRNMLYSIGFAPWYMATSFTPTEDDWKNTEWNNALPYFNYFDYVGLLWIGNSLEKEKAKRALKDITNQDFLHAADYLEWYYKNTFEYNFNLD